MIKLTAPQFPAVDATALAQRFDRLDEILKSAMVDGQLQTGTLHQVVESTKDSFVQKALTDILNKVDAFKVERHTEQVPVHGSRQLYSGSISSERYISHFEDRVREERVP